MLNSGAHRAARGRGRVFSEVVARLATYAKASVASDRKPGEALA